MGAGIVFVSVGLRVIFEAIRMVSPFLIVILILFIVKVLYRHKKYGYKEFDVFKKRTKKNHKKELMLLMLDKIGGYRKIINIKNLKSMFLIIDQTGIYLIYYYNIDGYISGNIDDKYLSKYLSFKNSVNVVNPYPFIEDDYKLILKNYSDIKIQKIVVINNACTLNVTNTDKFEPIHFKDFFYKMDTLLKNKKQIYTKNDVNIIYKKLSNF